MNHNSWQICCEFNFLQTQSWWLCPYPAECYINKKMYNDTLPSQFLFPNFTNLWARSRPRLGGNSVTIDQLQISYKVKKIKRTHVNGKNINCTQHHVKRKLFPMLVYVDQVVEHVGIMSFNTTMHTNQIFQWQLRWNITFELK